ncbi:dipeptide ABC transporter ATP-binding protein [Bacillus carboniphilus]|uniref:Dipeptide ABC transporter ATP-binding protein n=1 Tax=Bacillus carboniphilus TaxID=86663 RepID=A0ABN0VUH1_9BACI
MVNAEPLLKVENLKKYYPVKSGFFNKAKKYVRAVDDVSFEVFPGETIGVVGESGCGKSTLAKTLLRLIDSTSGHIFYDNTDLNSLSNLQMREVRKNLQFIFQDPYSSLNPRKTVEKIIEEPLVNLTDYSSKERKEIIRKTIKEVGLDTHHLNRYPHEFSGGQRQRIGIARALAVRPKFIICDEPVSALDVSIQAQILNLLKKLQKEYQLTYLFISHDLGVVRHFCNRIIVMYLGKIVEVGDKESIFNNPTHPYTKSILSAVPSIYHKRDRIILKGEVPSPINPPSGCPFHTRCPEATSACSQTEQRLEKIGDNHFVACHVMGQGDRFAVPERERTVPRST